MFMNCNEVFRPIVERKEIKYVFQELIYELWDRLILPKKVSTLVSLMTFLMFNDSSGAENWIY